MALATAKVFLFDLSALDVAYRVISLFVLGLLLLASAWLWQRNQRAAPAGEPVPDEADATPDDASTTRADDTPDELTGEPSRGHGHA